MKHRLQFTAKKLFRMVLLLLGVSLTAFLLMDASPLDPLQTSIGQVALGTMSPEQIAKLAAHQATMVIFLSVGRIGQLCEQLRQGGYHEDTPAAAVYKASWKDQKIVCGTLKDLAGKVQEAGIRKTALVMVGGFLGDEFEKSKLYDPGFGHEYRREEGKN